MRPGVRRSAVLRVRTGPSVRQARTQLSQRDGDGTGRDGTGRDGTGTGTGTGLPEGAFLGGAEQLLEPFLRRSEQLVHLRWLHADGGGP